MLERIIYVTIVISASLALGFFWAWRRKQKKLTKRVQVLENFKQAVKVLCPKIKDGEGMVEDEIEIKSPRPWPAPQEEDDTETAEMEIVTQGHPNDA